MDIIQTRDAEVIRVGKLEIRYLRDGKADSNLGSFELTVPPQAAVPAPHSHTTNDEWIYVLEGKFRYTVDGDVRDLSAGESTFSPRGSVHHFVNPFDQTAKVLFVQNPDIGAQYFRDVGAVVNAASPGNPPDKAKVIAVMTAYGLKPAMPVPA